MKNRYHVQSGEPSPSSGDEREWYVLDREQICSRDCANCDGTVVFVDVTRTAARQECAQRNADDETLILSDETIAALAATYPTCPRCGTIRMAGSDRVHALFCASDAKRSRRTVRSGRLRRP
jgi:ribosomal protein S27AE